MKFCGPVRRVHIPINKASGTKSGIAFVTFENLAGFLQGMAQDKEKLLDTEVRVSRSDAKAHSKSTSSASNNQSQSQGSRTGSGICFAYQKGDCTRGTNCRFSHGDDKRTRTTDFKGAENYGRGRESSIIPVRNEFVRGSSKDKERRRDRSRSRSRNRRSAAVKGSYDKQCRSRSRSRKRRSRSGDRGRRSRSRS